MSNNYYALLTGTIDSSVYNNTGNKITNIVERLAQYESAIERYITSSAFTHICFAENSGYPFNEDYFQSLAKENGKVFEFVRCPIHKSETIQHGKSYGEAAIIQDALSISKLLVQAETIYKMTGRIFLRNSKDIVSTSHKHRNEFIVYMNKKWCFTNIFKFNRIDYLRCWAKAKESCDEKSGNDIERVFYRILQDNPELDVGSFHVWPNFEGVQGATLELYSGGGQELLLRSIMCRIGFFKMHTFCAKLLRF